MKLARRAALACLAFAVSGAARAHSPIEGIGNFYNGLLHPVLVPAHLLLLVAVGLFLGQQGAKQIQPALGVFALTTTVGLAVSGFSATAAIEAIILVLSAAVGILVAASRLVNGTWLAIVAAFAGLTLGIDSAQETLSGTDRLVALAGSGLAICILLVHPIALADYAQERIWQRIGVRVIGSWVAASSLLVLALSFAPRQ